MSALRQAVADYLAVRRAVGFRLAGTDRWLFAFADYVEDRGGTVTVAVALSWAGESSSTEDGAARRLSCVRLFARYLQAFEPATEVPPAGLLPFRSHRAVPHLYSQPELAAMLAAARRLAPALWATSVETALGLLAVTGMRVGEVTALDDGDLDLAEPLLRVRCAKFGRPRLVPLSPSALAAVVGYRARRRALCPHPASPALLVDEAGRRLAYPRLLKAFHRVASAAGVAPGARLHDLRHSFAVATVLDWYRAGEDVQALLPRLSTYLGHVSPKSTYWYLSASPELMALVAKRLEPRPRRTS